MLHSLLVVDCKTIVESHPTNLGTVINQQTLSFYVGDFEFENLATATF